MALELEYAVLWMDNYCTVCISWTEPTEPAAGGELLRLAIAIARRGDIHETVRVQQRCATRGPETRAGQKHNLTPGEECCFE